MKQIKKIAVGDDIYEIESRRRLVTEVDIRGPRVVLSGNTILSPSDEDDPKHGFEVAFARALELGEGDLFPIVREALKDQVIEEDDDNWFDDGTRNVDDQVLTQAALLPHYRSLATMYKSSRDWYEVQYHKTLAMNTHVEHSLHDEVQSGIDLRADLRTSELATRIYAGLAALAILSHLLR